MNSRFLKSKQCALLVVVIGLGAAVCNASIAQEPISRGASLADQVSRGKSPEVVEVVQPEMVQAKPVGADAKDGTLEAGVSAADEIFRAGNPRNAARQYAVLSLRFGASAQLLTRRFVAQVAAGEFEQAAVIASLASLMGKPITTKELPGESLLGLGIDPVMAEALSEALAEMAVLQRIDPERLDVVAIWLRLSGNKKRSQVFAEEAGKIRAIQSRSLSPASPKRSGPALDLPPVVVPPATKPADSLSRQAPRVAPPSPVKPPASATEQGVLLLEPPR